MYKNPQSTIGSDVSEPFKVTKGHNQGCYMPLMLLKIYKDALYKDGVRANEDRDIIPPLLDHTLFVDDWVTVTSCVENTNYTFRKLVLLNLLFEMLTTTVSKTSSSKVARQRQNSPIRQKYY